MEIKRMKVCKMLSICLCRDCGIRSCDRPLVAGRSYGPWILNYTDAVLGVGADYREHGITPKAPSPNVQSNRMHSNCASSLRKGQTWNNE